MGQLDLDRPHVGRDPDAGALRERLVTEAGRDWRMRLACLDGGIVGFLAFDPGRRWLRQIFVRPSAKHSGVGTALLDIAKRVTSGSFLPRTDADNEAARRFYEHRSLRLDSRPTHEANMENKVVYLWP